MMKTITLLFHKSVDLALYCPEIPQNTGTLMRFMACMKRPIHIIFPCGFIFSDKRFQRAVMDYKQFATFYFHDSWADFCGVMSSRRLVLASLRATKTYTSFSFEPTDCIVMGQESKGFPEDIEATMSNKVYIPMQPGLRSMNMALAGAVIMGEALRQTCLFP